MVELCLPPSPSSTVAHATTPSPVQPVKCTELVCLPHATIWTLTGMCTGMKDTSSDSFLFHNLELSTVES